MEGSLEIGDGWLSLVKPLFAYIEEYNKTAETPIEVVQVKEKFGGLRFYVHHSTPELDDMIEQAEMKSYTTCEYCGKPGKTRSKNHWLCTLCKDCAKKLGYEKV